MNVQMNKECEDSLPNVRSISQRKLVIELKAYREGYCEL